MMGRCTSLYSLKVNKPGQAAVTLWVGMHINGFCIYILISQVWNLGIFFISEKATKNTLFSSIHCIQN